MKLGEEELCVEIMWELRESEENLLVVELIICLFCINMIRVNLVGWVKLFLSKREVLIFDCGIEGD